MLRAAAYGHSATAKFGTAHPKYIARTTMKNWRMLVLSTALIITPALTGCSTGPSGPTEHYVSPRIQGENQLINLEEVQKAFFDSKGTDFNTWMSAFEKKVNQIYDGKGVVMLDA